jgi:hypothetical protein
MNELNKYFQKSETVEILRSEIHPSKYNPRTISQEARKQLKGSVKRYGVVGGMIVNKQTGMTLVSGHQKLSILDELNNYNPETNENDYLLKVEVIDVDQKTEIELNIFFNNPNTQGTWDFDALAEIIPDIDYKSAGLTDADLQIIGVDFLLQTDEEKEITDSLDDLMAPVNEIKKKQLSKEEKITHNKEIKHEVAEKAQKDAEDMNAYVMITFDSFDSKREFLNRFGFDESEKFIKGEAFAEMVERIE